jgi:ABC-type antimicrobial peptide transport system permease subunit
MYSYTFRRITRSWQLFVAFFLGLTLAVSLFAGTIVGSDSVGYQTLAEAMTNVPVDLAETRIARNISSSEVGATLNSISTTVPNVAHTEAMYKLNISVQDANNGFTAPFTITALANTSVLLSDAVYSNTQGGLGVNQVLIEDGSINASKFSPGDIVTLRIMVQSQKPPKNRYFYYNLTLSGGVKLSDSAFSVAASLQQRQATVLFQQIILGGQPRRPPYSLMIISNETLFSIFSAISNSSFTSNANVATALLVWLNHDSILEPWDIGQSVVNVQQIQALITNIVSSGGYTSIDLLTLTLNGVQQLSNALEVIFIVLALPVFFTAWYMGRTVSDVSMNLRRREIGLLLTKGFSKNQVLMLFIVETLLLSSAAGVLGLIIGVAILPLVGLEANIWGGFQLLDVTTIIFVMVFSAVIAFLSVISPARKASKMKIIDATREYAPEESEVKPKMRWPAVALFFGAYKIVAYLVGFNLQAYSAPGRGLFVLILFRIVVFADRILGYVAPVLFFWGFTRIFIQGSFNLQEMFGKISSHIAGDLGEIASENAKLNTRRTAAVAFMVALIIGYSVSVVGGLASTNDFIQRSIYNNVGADVSVGMFSEQNATLVKSLINNLTEVSSSTIERWLFVTTSFGIIQIRAISPSPWQSIAYYESDWFSGSSIDSMFNELTLSNKTIILDRSIADQYGLSVGQNITVTLGSKIYPLVIVGFFGISEPSTSGATFWSYIPEGLYNQTRGVEVSQTRILVKLAVGANGTKVAEEIEGLNTNIERVDAVETQMSLVESNIFLSGPRRVFALGVPFALLISSVGVVLLTVTTLRERKKEITLMAVKGFSLSQIFKAQLLENLGIICFSILLGVFVGYVTTIGNVQSQNATPALVMRNTVFPADSILNILIIVGILLASIVLPILVMVRRYSEKLEWRIRG